MWNRARAALDEARALGVSTNYSAWFGGGTNASAAVLAPAQIAAVAPLVRVTAAYVVMYYAFCFFQSWSKLYLSASRRPGLFLVRRLVLLRFGVGEALCTSTRGVPLASVAAMACRVRHREIGTATPPHTPSTRHAIDATHVFIDETQAADSAPERRR